MNISFPFLSRTRHIYEICRLNEEHWKEHWGGLDMDVDLVGSGAWVEELLIRSVGASDVCCSLYTPNVLLRVGGRDMTRG